MRNYLIYLALAMGLFACNKGEILDNQPPETNIFVSSINLTGPDRLTSEVSLFWSGADKDGFVENFEISFDNLNWAVTDKQDSTFIFDLSGGQDTIDIDFYVRARDNLGLLDPTPAFLKVPIKNSPPIAEFDSLFTLNDTVYSVLSLLVNVSDPDGEETLDSLFLKINSGPWYHLDPGVSFITLVPTDPEQSGAVDCDVYFGIDPILLPTSISGFVLEGNNEIYLKVKDNAGAVSETDTTKVIYAKKKSNDFLIIDSHPGGISPTPEEVYFPIFTSLGISYDLFDIERNNGENLPFVLNPTMGFLMNMYDEIFWYSDDSPLDGQHYLEAAASLIQEYLNQGGKILITTRLANDFVNTSPITQFSPMDSLSSSAGQARVPTDSLLIPWGNFAANYDTLESSSFISGADPFYPSDSNNIMFTAQLQKVGGWDGPNIIAARTTNATRTNQVFVTVELHRINGRALNLEMFFSEVLNNEFNW